MPAQSKAQQRFMGMVHAVQKGDMEAPSKEVEKAADSMSKKDAKDYASTSHKGLPNKKENMNITRERLKELVKEVMTEESEYQTFFQKALDKAGKGINDMNDDEKKAFFNKIDAAWNGKGEKNEELTGGQHKLDVDKDGDIEGDDLADLRAGKKVDENIASELPKASIPAAVSQRLKLAIDKIKDAKLNPTQKLQLIAQVVDSIGVDKSQLGTITNKIRSKMESIRTEAELPAATLPGAIQSKLMMAIAKIKDTNLTFNQKVQVIGKVMDGLGIDKSEFNKMSSRLKGSIETPVKQESSIKEESPCWKGYQQIGMKDKNGKQVPNCVPEGKMNEGKKVFKVNPGIGKAKYSISSHDGKKTHKDGSDFYDIEIFNNKVELEKGIKKYTSKGFVKESINEGVSPKDMDKIKSAVEAASSFMNVGAQLKSAGLRYIFATEPMAIYIVNPTPNSRVAIVNKRYASKPDFVVGDIAVGIMEGIQYTKK